MGGRVLPVTWDEWPEVAPKVFQAMRSPAGEEMVLVKNVFVERILPLSVLRGLTEAEMAVYRRPYLEPGESRRPTLTWPRQIPIDGEPADVVAIVDDYARWLATSDVPKLFVNAEPGTILTGPQREFCRTWPSQQEITVRGRHLVQADPPRGTPVRRQPLRPGGRAAGDRGGGGGIRGGASAVTARKSRTTRRNSSRRAGGSQGPGRPRARGGGGGAGG